MKRDISEKVFDSLSKEKKKQYVAELLIRASAAAPIRSPKSPVAIIMAGLPGAGKTEFLDTFDELLKKNNFEPFIRIDLDQIVTIFPRYTPQSYERFRSPGNYVLARCIDVARTGNYNMMIDGTFSGTTGASINNVARLLSSGYLVEMYYMYDDASTAWNYTRSREVETKRGITKDSFLHSCLNIKNNLKLAVTKFGDNPKFRLNVVVQKELRDKEYKILTASAAVDAVIDKGYNIDKINDIL